MRTHSITGESGPHPPTFAAAPAGAAGSFLVVASEEGLHDPGRGLSPVPRFPGIRLIGQWPDTEYRVADVGFALVVLLGHCLPSTKELARHVRASSADDDALMDLPGAFTCLVARPDRLVVYTDLAAAFPVYHSTRDGRTLVGSDPRLLASLHDRTPDPLTAALRIACTDVLPLWEQRSVFDGVSRLPGGHALEVLHHPGASARVHSYMKPESQTGMTRAEGAAALGTALRRAVALRGAEGLVTSDFSGGLDSTSLALLAAGHGSAPLPAVVYHHPGAPAGDLDAACGIAGQAAPRIDLTVVQGTQETLPYTGQWTHTHPWPVGPEPWAGSFDWRRSALRLSFAAAHRAATHLTGEGGDALLSAPPCHLADLARWRSGRSLFAHATALSRARDVSRVRVMVRARRLRHTTPAQALSSLAAQLMTADAEPDRRHEWLDAISWWPVHPEALSWLTASARDGIAEVAAEAACTDALPPETRPARLAAATALRLSAEAQIHLRTLGRHYGIAVHAPFLDPAVIRAALGVPAALRADARRFKPLLGTALPELEPRSLFDRHTKGDYTAEHFLGVRANWRALRDLIDDSRLAQLGVVDPDRVRRSLGRLRAGIAVPLGPLNQLLAVEAWLRALDTPESRGR